MSTDVKSAIDLLGREWEAFKQADQATKGRAESERKEILEKVDRAVDEAMAAKKAAEDAAVKAARFAVAGGGSEKPADEHKSAFLGWLRAPRDQKALAALQDVERKAVFTTGTGGSAAGGYAVPKEIAAAVIAQITNISPLRQLATVVPASTSDYKQLVDTLGTATAWAGEKATRNETNTAQLGEVAPTFGTLYAYPKATEESLQDIFFDVEGWLTQSISVAMAAAESLAFTTGDGSNKPTGVMSATKSANADASLTFGQTQYIPTGAAAGFPPLSTTSPRTYPGDVLVDTVFALKAGYRPNARWMMNKATLAVVRKFKDVDANYLWQPGLAAGVPSTLLGYPVVENEDMAAIGSNAFPIAFGDFRAGYLIVDLVGMRVTLDEVTTPGYIKWHVRKRVGGKLLDNQAIKVIKCATT